MGGIKIPDINCNSETTKLKSENWILAVNVIEYNAKNNSDFDKTKLECQSGTRYFYKSKSVTTSDCNPIDKKYTDKGYTMTIDVEEYRKVKNKGTYYTAYYDCKTDGKKHYFYKLKGTTPDPEDEDITPSPGPTSYEDCTGGPYHVGCKSTDGVIGQVQGCLGVNPDGKFGPKTEAALNSKTGKNTFTKDEVSKICSGSSTEGEQLKPFNKEEQKLYWEELKTNGQITSLGVLKGLKGGNTIVYIYKKNKQSGKKELTTLQEIDFSTPEKMDQLIKKFDLYDFIVLYPINPNSPNASGQVGVMTAGLNQNDEVTVAIVKDGSGSWKPSEKTTSFEDEEGDSFISETIKRILQHRLDEQIVNINLSSSSDPNKVGTATSSNTNAGSTTTSGNQASTTSGGGQTPTKINVDDETIKIMTPIKQKALQVINDWDNYNDGLKGMSLRALGKGKINTEIDNARSVVESTNPKDFCSDKVKRDINNSKTDLSNKKNEYDNILTSQDKSYMSELEGLLGQLLSGCKTISSMSSGNQLSTNTSGNQTTTNQIASTTPNPNPNPGLSAGEQTTTPPDCSMTDEMLVNYIIDGLQGVKLNSAKIVKQKQDLCYCYKTGGFNDMNARKKIGDLFKRKIELKSGSIDQNVAPEKQLFRRLSNKNLGWNEMSKLIRGEEVFKVSINREYRDMYFGTDSCKSTVVSESLKNKVGRKIYEAINNKKKDVMVESILSHIKNTRR
jgi:hypothetical protein